MRIEKIPYLLKYTAFLIIPYLTGLVKGLICILTENFLKKSTPVRRKFFLGTGVEFQVFK